MKPAFKEDGDTVTAVNASGINDGPFGVMLMGADEAFSAQTLYVLRDFYFHPSKLWHAHNKQNL